MKKLKKNIVSPLIILLLSCEAIFVEDISESEIVLLSPSDESVVNLDSIRFDWQKVDEATLYKFQIATPSFENANQIVVDSIISTLNVIIPLTDGDYEWRVKALNSEFETLYTTNSLTVE